MRCSADALQPQPGASRARRVFESGTFIEGWAVYAEELMAEGYRSEAVGKWRRVQLTSTQLCTYYVGYHEMRDIGYDLRAARPDWSARQVHDAMLSFGSPPPRHVRTLLGLR